MRTFEEIICSLAAEPVIRERFHLSDSWSVRPQRAVFVTAENEDEAHAPIIINRDGKMEMSLTVSPEQMVAVARACAEIARIDKKPPTAAAVAESISRMLPEDRYLLAKQLPYEAHGVFLIDYADPNLEDRVAAMLMHDEPLYLNAVNRTINTSTNFGPKNIYLIDEDPEDIPTQADIDDAREEGADQARREIEYEKARFDENTRLFPSGQTALDFLSDFAFRARGHLAIQDEANIEALIKLFQKG